MSKTTDDDNDEDDGNDDEEEDPITKLECFWVIFEELLL